MNSKPNHDDGINCWCGPQIRRQCLICLGSGENPFSGDKCDAPCDRGWVVISTKTAEADESESPLVVVHSDQKNPLEPR